MNYAIIVAGGCGNRIKDIDIPKQFYEINGIAIIIYSLKKLLSIDMFDKIYIAVNEDYYHHTENLLEKFIPKEKLNDIKLLIGGEERIDSIHNALEEIKKEELNDDDIVVIHDAVRPFVSKKILIDNINGAKKYGAVVTAVAATDTMLISNDQEKVTSIPQRETVYKEQTPTSVNLKKLIELENNLTKEEKSKITGTAQIFIYNNCDIKIVNGSDSNFKITTKEDLDRAKQKLLKLTQ